MSDAAPCPRAALDDLDFECMAQFTRTAGRARQFSLPEETPPRQLLEHLNLLNGGRPTHAAVLLFGKSPQRFLISSEISVEVVTEAVVNAVAHRDYTDNGSVQVMLFADRLEVRNPGRLPPPLTLEKLREAHRSVPGNPLLAESLYLAEYIERMGTGTLDIIERCRDAGLPEPEFAVTDGFVTTVLRASPPGGGTGSSAGGRSQECGRRPRCKLGCKLTWGPEKLLCCDPVFEKKLRARSCRPLPGERAASSGISTAC